MTGKEELERDYLFERLILATMLSIIIFVVFHYLIFKMLSTSAYGEYSILLIQAPVFIVQIFLMIPFILLTWIFFTRDKDTASSTLSYINLGISSLPSIALFIYFILTD